MEAVWTDFKSSRQEIIEKRVSTKMTSARHSDPWMNGSTKCAIRRKQRAYGKSKRTQSKRDRDMYRRLQQQVQWETSRSHTQFMQDVVSEAKPGRVAQSVGLLTRKSGVLGSIPGLATYFCFSFRFLKKGSCQLLAKVCARSTG